MPGSTFLLDDCVWFKVLPFCFNKGLKLDLNKHVHMLIMLMIQSFHSDVTDIVCLITALKHASLLY